MQIVTVECQLLSPLFMAGVDVSKPELRTSGIKGMMRYWWRALHGNLSVIELKKLEIEVFGGIGKQDTGRKSPFSMRVEHNMDQGSFPLVPHRQGVSYGFVPGSTFNVIFMLPQQYKFCPNTAQDASINKLVSLFRISCALGGFGRRSRRGMGSIIPISATINNQRRVLPSVDNLATINELIQLFNADYSETSNRIVLNSTYKATFPYIKEISIGNTQRDDILKHISNQTHYLKERNTRDYNTSIGNSRPRLASPVIISLINAETSIVTIMHLDGSNVNTSLQQQLRDNVL
jgi:CRISPR-associated protein Cmr1